MVILCCSKSFGQILRSPKFTLYRIQKYHNEDPNLILGQKTTVYTNVIVKTSQIPFAPSL